MDTKKIKQLIELFEQTDLEELSLEIDDMKIAMKQSRTLLQPVNPSQTFVTLESSQEKVEPGFWVTAPFVGTFYSTPSSEAQPFVKVGQTVKEGDTLCILEAMKVMNELKSPRDGVVLEISVDNGSMVEYGQNIFRLGDIDD